MLSLKNFLTSLLLIIAIGLCGWSIVVANHLKTTTENNPTQPDAFMENVIITTLDKEGKPAMKLETPRITHYPEHDMTDIVTPHVTAYRQSPNPWHINSEHAKTTGGTSEILFWSRVIIHHLADTENPATMMETNSLTIFPDKQIAKTSDAVKITQPDTIVNSVGMLANWDDGTVQLLSQAKGEYVPHSG